MVTSGYLNAELHACNSTHNGDKPCGKTAFLILFNGNPHPFAFRAVFPAPKAFQGYLTFHLAIGFQPAVEEIPLYSPIQDI
jgi:hypothetical protein